MGDVETKKLTFNMNSSIFKFRPCNIGYILKKTVAQKQRCCLAILINKTYNEFNLQTFGEKIVNLQELGIYFLHSK